MKKKKRIYHLKVQQTSTIDIEKTKRIINGGFISNFWEREPFLPVSDTANVFQVMQCFPRCYPCSIKFIDDSGSVFYRTYHKIYEDVK